MSKLHAALLLGILGLVGCEQTPTDPIEIPIEESPSPSPTPTRSPSPSPTPTRSPSPSPTPTRSPSPSPTPTRSPSPSPTPTRSPSPTPTATVTPSPTPTRSPSPSPTPAKGPIGYAAGTTGGGNATPKVVTTFSALKSAAEASGSAVIHVKGVLKGTSGIRVKSNKTIIGLSGSAIEGAGFLVYAQTNIIFRNLTIRNTTVTDGITIKDGTTRVWVDHCTFSGADYDGLLDITDGSDLVTVSWSKFTGASKCSLVGGGYHNPRDVGKLRVTYHHNLFQRNLERGPKVSVGTAHVFNNYYLESSKSGTYHGYAIGSAAGAVVRAENNFFEDFQGNPLVDLKDDTSDYGKFSAVNTNIYRNSGPVKIRSSASTWAPSYEYKSVLIPAADVPAAVLKGAGAK